MVSKTIYSFELSVQEGHTILTVQGYPWSVLQVVPTTPEEFDNVKEVLKKRGFVAHHGTDRTFFIIHIGGGNYDGKHPERFVHITQDNYKAHLEAMKDAMGQAAVWYYTNVVRRMRGDSIV